VVEGGVEAAGVVALPAERWAVAPVLVLLQEEEGEEEQPGRRLLSTISSHGSSYAGLVAPDMAGTTERGPLQEERMTTTGEGWGRTTSCKTERG